MVLSIIFLEDEHTILLHLSILYEYQPFFSTPCLFFDTAATSTRKFLLMEGATLKIKIIVLFKQPY
jgi:hypothetical protein